MSNEILKNAGMPEFVGKIKVMTRQLIELELKKKRRVRAECQKAIQHILEREGMSARIFLNPKSPI